MDKNTMEKQNQQTKTKEEIKLIEEEAGLLSLKQIWLDNVDMKRGTYWREFLGYFRFNIIFFLLSVTNWICLTRKDLELTTFLIWLNGTIWIGMMILMSIIDLKRDKIVRSLSAGVGK